MGRDTWTRTPPSSAEDRYASCTGCGGSGQVRNPYFPSRWDSCGSCGGSGEVRR